MENKDLKTRREFFKEATKKSLPILGALALMSNPVIAKTVEREVTDCNQACVGSCGAACTTCWMGCSGTCQSCKQGCASDCTGKCNGWCRDNCEDTCKDGCKKGCGWQEKYPGGW